MARYCSRSVDTVASLPVRCSRLQVVCRAKSCPRGYGRRARCALHQEVSARVRTHSAESVILEKNRAFAAFLRKLGRWWPTLVVARRRNVGRGARVRGTWAVAAWAVTSGWATGCVVACGSRGSTRLPASSGSCSPCCWPSSCWPSSRRTGRTACSEASTCRLPVTCAPPRRHA